jgi:hypothetical protein
VNPSVRLIIELNIGHLEGLLTAEADPVKRRTITTLLAEERGKLAKLMARPDDGGRGTFLKRS